MKLLRLFLGFSVLINLLLSCSTTPEQQAQERLRQEVLLELQYGKLLSQKILTTYPLYKNDKATLYVNKVGKSVALFAGRPELTYHFAILNTNSVNAFAAPGGYIYITKGALKIMENEAQLAAVLAHEIGHVNNRHIMKQLPPPRETGAASAISSLLVSQGTIVSSAMNESVAGASNLLFVRGYKIKDEYEADLSAIDYLDAAGYNPASLISFLQAIDSFKKKQSSTQVYHTHPPNNERITRLSTYIKSQNIQTKNKPVVKWRFDQNMNTVR
jgi:predicted Zn-dependent protease